MPPVASHAWTRKAFEAHRVRSALRFDTASCVCRKDTAHERGSILMLTAHGATFLDAHHAAIVTQHKPHVRTTADARWLQATSKHDCHYPRLTPRPGLHRFGQTRGIDCTRSPACFHLQHPSRSMKPVSEPIGHKRLLDLGCGVAVGLNNQTVLNKGVGSSDSCRTESLRILTPELD